MAFFLNTILVVNAVPFSIASAKAVFLDVKEQTIRNAFSINLGLNTLAVLFFGTSSVG